MKPRSRTQEFSVAQRDEVGDALDWLGEVEVLRGRGEAAVRRAVVAQEADAGAQFAGEAVGGQRTLHGGEEGLSIGGETQTLEGLVLGPFAVSA